MTLKETLRYLENSDASSISFKEFAKTPKDTYPTFSICITDYQDNDGLLYSFMKRDIMNTFTSINIGTDCLLNIDPHHSYTFFSKILKGKEVKLPYTSPNGLCNVEQGMTKIDARNISVDYFNYLTIDLKALFFSLEFKTEDPNSSIYMDVETLQPSSQLPFYVSHQDPESICFTRQEDELANTIRISDMISLFKSKLEEFEPQTTFNFYLHHPGQLLRVLHSPIYRSTVSQFLAEDGMEVKNNQLVLKISMVSILRKRSDANIPCNNTLHDDDLQLRKEISKLVGCIPIYWNKIMPSDFNLDICKSPEDLAKTNSLLEDLGKIQSTYQHPCNEMRLSFTYEKRVGRFGGAHLVTTEFEYMDKIYEEIINERDFGFESFWSAVGGFVGIFVGASLSQIPIMITGAWKVLSGVRKTK